MAGFCKLAVGLRAPKLVAAGAKSPIVSGGYLKYSRFRETAAGDRVRSGLRGGARYFLAASPLRTGWSVLGNWDAFDPEQRLSVAMSEM